MHELEIKIQDLKLSLFVTYAYNVSRNMNINSWYLNTTSLDKIPLSSTYYELQNIRYISNKILD